jgi:5'-3' exonuclease
VACDWLLVDGSSLIFRAFYGTDAGRRSPGGAPVNAVHGFLDRLARLIVTRRPRRLAVADDWAWRPEWRVSLLPGYKSHRVAEPVPAALEPQIDILQTLMEALGVDLAGADGHEAEDVIATWSRQATGTIEIASGDRDLFALIQDPRVRVLYPEKGGLAVIDEGEVTRRYGIPGRRYADFAILRGDPSDGLPGLRGVGAVTAAGLIRRHGDIAGVLRDRPLGEDERDYLARAQRVVVPVDDLPIALPAGRRDDYPARAAAAAPLIAEHGAQESCARLVAALTGLAAAA